MSKDCKDKKCDCSGAACGDCCCCGVCKELPEYLECCCARKVYLKALIKAEAKRCCCIKGQLKGLGMGMPLWLPEMCDKAKLEEASKCLCECESECKEKGKEKAKEKEHERKEEMSCFLKELKACPLVPQYIKDTPALLCVFSKQVLRTQAKQALKARCLLKSAAPCCCGCCDCKGASCGKEECHKDEHK